MTYVQEFFLMTDPRCECGKVPSQGERFDRAKHCVECTKRLRRGGDRIQQKKEAAKRPLPCVFLGHLEARARCNCPRKDVRYCDYGLGKVTQEKDCEDCEYYMGDDPNGDTP